MLHLLSIAAAASPCSDNPHVPCVAIPPCDSARAKKRPLQLASPYGRPTRQKTDGAVCWNSTGLLVSVDAAEAHVVSPYTTCNSPVFLGSCTFEFFISPVQHATDAPSTSTCEVEPCLRAQRLLPTRRARLSDRPLPGPCPAVNYFEINAAPSGAMFVQLNNNSLGNVSTCSDREACRERKLDCEGRATYPPYSKLGFGARPANTSSGWRNELFVPFGLFPEFVSLGRPWPAWRLNLYRYGYPDAPRRVPCDPHWGARCQNFSNFELSAWSPTYDGSFHVPERFGVGFLVDDAGRTLPTAAPGAGRGMFG